MKVLVVLALVVFTGCNASPAIRQKPKLQVMLDFFVDYALLNYKAAHEIFRHFKRTEFGNTVMNSLEEAAVHAREVLEKAQKSIPHSIEEKIEFWGEKSGKLISKVVRNVVDNHLEPMVKNHVEPMAESAAPVMEEALGELMQRSQMLQDLVSPYITELMERLDPMFQEIQARLDALNKSLVKTE